MNITKYMLLGLAIFIIVGGAAYYFTQIQNRAIDTSNWPVYQNDEYAVYEIKHPEGAEVSEGAGGTRIDLPFEEETTLVEKYFQIGYTGQDSEAKCSSAHLGQVFASEMVSINGLEIHRETGAEEIPRAKFDYVGYTVGKDGLCYQMKFVLRSVTEGVSGEELEQFDKEQEMKFVEAMIQTFRFTN
ncbi:MAG TPA: hypothetical protein VFE94_02510 [Candidatus Paceibacterota bacterium]|nr:hypothetical protein [Candidatus Paceibacterota bacterium]